MFLSFNVMTSHKNFWEGVHQKGYKNIPLKWYDNDDKLVISEYIFRLDDYLVLYDWSEIYVSKLSVPIMYHSWSIFM